jgi:hypothetical protein
MPKSKVTEQFACEFCGKAFNDYDQAETCESGHDVVYVPMERADLKAIIAFVTTGNIGYVMNRKGLVKRLRMYNNLRGER